MRRTITVTKTKAVWKKCDGEAHSNPFIDNCGVCMPFWGSFPTCPTDGRKLTTNMFCRTCRKHFAR